MVVGVEAVVGVETVELAAVVDVVGLTCYPVLHH